MPQNDSKRCENLKTWASGLEIIFFESEAIGYPAPYSPDIALLGLGQAFRGLGRKNGVLVRF
jgi:hypothetical protein